MQCCGATSWADYMDPDIVKGSLLDRRKSRSGSSRVIPYSCCKDHWVRNLQCSEGIHELAAPGQPPKLRAFFQERIYQEVCTVCVHE
jgi:hypothetical protein